MGGGGGSAGLDANAGRVGVCHVGEVPDCGCALVSTGGAMGALEGSENSGTAAMERGSAPGATHTGT